MLPVPERTMTTGTGTITNANIAHTLLTLPFMKLHRQYSHALSLHVGYIIYDDNVPSSQLIQHCRIASLCPLPFSIPSSL
jgi:hypothetical protein